MSLNIREWFVQAKILLMTQSIKYLTYFMNNIKILQVFAHFEL